jgi:hypothetical protein
MNYIKISILFIVVFLLGCTSWKSSLNRNGDFNVAIKNAVIDMIHTNERFIQNDSVFSVNTLNLNGNLIGVSFFGTVNKFIIINNKKTDSSMFPTRYYEHSNKLFYWKDSNVELNNEIIEKLHQYNMIDTLESIAFAELNIDDSKKGIHYYFCKNNLSKYKKVKTNRILGSYEMPKLNCK